MRKITVFLMITLDGVIQAPGGKKEDASVGFKHGGCGITGGPDRAPLTEKTLLLTGKTSFAYLSSLAFACPTIFL